MESVVLILVVTMIVAGVLIWAWRRSSVVSVHVVPDTERPHVTSLSTADAGITKTADGDCARPGIARTPVQPVKSPKDFGTGQDIPVEVSAPPMSAHVVEAQEHVEHQSENVELECSKTDTEIASHWRASYLDDGEEGHPALHSWSVDVVRLSDVRWRPLPEWLLRNPPAGVRILAKVSLPRDAIVIREQMGSRTRITVRHPPLNPSGGKSPYDPSSSAFGENDFFDEDDDDSDESFTTILVTDELTVYLSELR